VSGSRAAGAVQQSKLTVERRAQTADHTNRIRKLLTLPWKEFRMKSKPVRKYSQPKYPTRLEIAARPALLHRHQPPSWRKWPELTGAAGLFLLADATRLPAADSPPNASQNPAAAKAVAVVAPIFEHGKGRGATGCIVMSPPVFLSEEEALQVIREEMAAKGLELATNQTAVAGVTLADWSLPKPGVPKSPNTYKACAADPKKKVFVEFVSQRKAWRWNYERGKEEGNLHLSTVQSYDMPKTAAYVAKRVKQQAADKIYFGTLYDPIAGTIDIQKAAAQSPPGKSTGQLTRRLLQLRVDARAESRRLLRLQVQDFLEWLQAQGAI